MCGMSAILLSNRAIARNFPHNIKISLLCRLGMGKWGAGEIQLKPNTQPPKPKAQQPNPNS